MALTFDGPNKLIVLSTGTVSLSVRDLWSRWVDWWLTAGDNSKFMRAMDTVGGNDIDLGAGTKIPIYAFLQNGWKLRPQEANHTLNVGDGVLLVDGGGDPFVNTTGSYVVRINYQQPVQAISFDTGGGGGLTVDQATQLLEVYQRLGLAAGKPLTQTATEISTEDFTLAVAEPVAGTVTVTRQ
ncbi:MAG TPA: hypothetical protein PLF91_10675 [Mycolicibacterium fallax]|nr:hypothetical protein [Mycolicibacterium fallax]